MFVPDTADPTALARASWALAYGTLEHLVRTNIITPEDAQTILSSYRDYYRGISAGSHQTAADYLEEAKGHVAKLTL